MKTKSLEYKFPCWKYRCPCWIPNCGESGKWGTTRGNDPTTGAGGAGGGL